jgi:hypothetical protein
MRSQVLPSHAASVASSELVCQAQSADEHLLLTHAAADAANVRAEVYSPSSIAQQCPRHLPSGMAQVSNVRRYI